MCLQHATIDNRERQPECGALSRGNCRRSCRASAPAGNQSLRLCRGELYAEESVAPIGWGPRELRFYEELRQFLWICLRRKQATHVIPAVYIGIGASCIFFWETHLLTNNSDTWFVVRGSCLFCVRWGEFKLD